MKRLSACAVLLLALLLFAAGAEDRTVRSADKIVPAEAELVQALEAAGYTVTRETVKPEGGLPADRLIARRGKRLIDICCGLTDADAPTAFAEYERLYGEEDYYILAQNERDVYCVSDKRTFKIAGFSGIANIGVQYIHE